MNQSPSILWTPSPAFKSNSNLTQFMNWLAEQKQLSFDSYDAVWEWSINNTSSFWECLYEYFDIQSHIPYTQVQSPDAMPNTKWFTGAEVNYAEHIFRNKTQNFPAIIFKQEGRESKYISWEELENRTAALASYLKAIGIKKGDRVAAFIPNIPEATIGFLATCSIGAVWSSCSPDFGAGSVIDRFKQIEPKVLVTVDGYLYGGKPFDKTETVKALIDELPTIEQVIQIPYLGSDHFLDQGILWSAIEAMKSEKLSFTPVEFEHPIWVLYSSGTTGQPKAITHSQGGMLLEHLKYVTFQNDVKRGERFFWFTTTGWMMWNYVQATLLVGATIVLYDGSPAYPSLSSLWEFAEKEKLAHFGTSAPFIVACMKRKLQPGLEYDFSSLRSINSTGSPLPPEAYHWIYKEVKKDVWLVSISGGTDVCSAFVGGCPTEPVYEGEIQRRALGCAMFSFDENGTKLVDEVGEMVVTEPMPCMPIYFWNDPDKKRYKESYFEEYPGVWRHGDWLLITSRNTLVIKGRSDATLNRHGVRIGTAEIYQAVNKISVVKDSLVVNIELENGNHFMPLFLVMNEGESFSPEVKKRIIHQLKQDFSPRHVPDTFVVAPDIPYTISGKKMESPVKKILQGIPIEKAANLGAMRNPESLKFFQDFSEKEQARFK